jgi:hypothetical protein
LLLASEKRSLTITGGVIALQRRFGISNDSAAGSRLLHLSHPTTITVIFFILIGEKPIINIYVSAGDRTMIDITATSALYCSSTDRTMPLPVDDDAVNQYDYPSNNSTVTDPNNSSNEPIKQQQQQQDIDFDLFTANAQVIPSDHTTTTEGIDPVVIMTNSDAMTTSLHNNTTNTTSTNQKEGNNAVPTSSLILTSKELLAGGPHRHHPTTTCTHDDAERAVVKEPMTNSVGEDTMTPPPQPPPPQQQQRFVSPKDFELLTVIGMGAFGKVLQVRNKCNQQIYAMKIISKRLLYKKGIISSFYRDDAMFLPNT